jgi:2-methylcitrate dehydratase
MRLRSSATHARQPLKGPCFVNGVLVRSLDLNDTCIGTESLHPSEVLPTALALCEEKR